MSNFDHYHDMDHDGDHDLKDSGMFHDMMSEWTTPGGSGSSHPIGGKGKSAPRGSSKDDVLTTRIAWGICALITGIPGFILLSADVSESLLLSALTLMLLVGFVLSLKCLLFDQLFASGGNDHIEPSENSQFESKRNRQQPRLVN